MKNLTRAALLLALTLTFQSLRYFVPIPIFLSTFLIGSLVNACLLVALEMIGPKPALAIGFIAPVIAYFQQLLPLPIMILPVALGNAIYIGVFFSGVRWQSWLRIGVAGLSKAVFMYGAFSWLLMLIAIPAKLASSLLFVMSWPQFVTGVVGGLLASIVKKRLQRLL
ncbi:hypothetical protein [Pelosinus sp. sgz500959]|uniref:hypothetical protein n=1 Tax=Pelosinus sp. sgz500959 TaxID=3242472 RepID=UPI00366D8C43